MNDEEEHLWAGAQLEVVLQRLHDRDDVPNEVPVVPKKTIEKFREHYQDASKCTRQFLACFSTSGDSLSQWRAYADDAQGFSIGFDTSDLDVPAKIRSVQ